MRRSGRRWRAGLWLGYVCLLLAGLDLVIRWTGLEARLLAPLLYYQHDQLSVHRPSQDPARIFELAPGARNRTEVDYTINSLGFRDRERAPAKPPGVKRIIVLGGSTTFGAGVADDETFPARLEQLLDKKHPGKFEVWNAGTCAYVLSQEVALAEEIIERYAPDALVFQYLNRGRRAFLLDQDPSPLLKKDPGLYPENLRFFPPPGAGRRLFSHWAFFRAAVIGLNRLEAVPNNNPGYDDEGSNLAAFRAFRETHGRKLPIVLLTLDANLSPELASTGAPVITLFAKENLPALPSAELFPAHPPACAFNWYAEVLAYRLSELAPELFDGRPATRPVPKFSQACWGVPKDGQGHALAAVRHAPRSPAPALDASLASEEKLGRLLLLHGRLGRHARVLELADKLSDRWWRDPAVPLTCATAAAALGREPEARGFLERARNLPFTEDAVLWIATVERRLGDASAALQTIARLVETRPANSHAWILSAEIAASRSDCARTRRDLAVARKLLSAPQAPKTSFADALRHRAALTYQECREYGLAVSVLEELATRNPTIAVYRKDLGVSRYLLGRKEEAKADWKAAIRLDPGLRAAYASLAAALESEGRTAEARAVCSSRPGACR